MDDAKGSEISDRGRLLLAGPIHNTKHARQNRGNSYHLNDRPTSAQESPGTRPELRIPTLQLKRELPLWPEFGWFPGNLGNLS
jgi:hypothetical protein